MDKSNMARKSEFFIRRKKKKRIHKNLPPEACSVIWKRSKFWLCIPRSEIKTPNYNFKKKRETVGSEREKEKNRSRLLRVMHFD